MSEHKEPIPSMLYNAAVGGHVANSQQIIDENLNREQQDINEEVVAVPYNATTPNGMGKVVLKKNDNFKQVVEAQTDGNTIFVIKYDFTLTGDVTVPANCILQFDGGSIRGAYTVTGNNTIIKAVSIPIFDTNITIDGLWQNDMVVEWFGLCGNADDSNVLNRAISISIALSKNMKCENTYNIGSTLNIDRLTDGLSYNNYFRIYGGGKFVAAANITLFSTSNTSSNYILFDNLHFSGDSTSLVLDRKLIRVHFVKCTFSCKLCYETTSYIQSWYFTECIIPRPSFTTSDAWMQINDNYDISFVNCSVDAQACYGYFVNSTGSCSSLRVTNTLVESLSIDAFHLSKGSVEISNCYFEGIGNRLVYQYSGLLNFNGCHCYYGSDYGPSDSYAIEIYNTTVKSHGNFFNTLAYKITGISGNVSSDDGNGPESEYTVCSDPKFAVRTWQADFNVTQDIGNITKYAGNINAGNVIINSGRSNIVAKVCVQYGTYQTAKWKTITDDTYTSTYELDADFNNMPDGRFYPNGGTDNWYSLTANMSHMPTGETNCGVLEQKTIRLIKIQEYTTYFGGSTAQKLYRRCYNDYAGNWSVWTEII